MALAKALKSDRKSDSIGEQCRQGCKDVEELTIPRWGLTGKRVVILHSFLNQVWRLAQQQIPDFLVDRAEKAVSGMETLLTTFPTHPQVCASKTPY